MKNKEFIRTIKFTIFSLSAGLIEAGSFHLLSDLFKIKAYWICYLVPLILSVIWNFTLNREFTFKSANNIPKAMLQVFIYYLIFTPITTIGGNYLVTRHGFNKDIVNYSSMALNFITEFLVDRFIVFKDSIDTKEK